MEQNKTDSRSQVKTTVLRISLIMVCAAILALPRLIAGEDAYSIILERATLKSIELMMADVPSYEEEKSSLLESSNITDSTTSQNEESKQPTSTTAQQTTTQHDSKGGTTTAATTATSSRETKSTAPVKEVKFGDTSLKYGNVSVKNGNSTKLDIENVLSQKPDCKILKNAGYQVLIVHTHTTECYAEGDWGYYYTDYSPRTTDKSKSVVAVGAVIADKLNASGIRALHVTTMHDYPKYNGSYDRAKETIEEYLKKYPSIEMVIDVHRDAITYDSAAKAKPTAIINGKKAAQVMIISGCDENGKLGFPDWQYNLRMGLRLQKQLASDYPGLARPLYFAPYRYNMHLTHNSLLIEFGTDANTLEEAKYSAEMVGDALSKVLEECVVG